MASRPTTLEETSSTPASGRGAVAEVARAFLALGLTAFGGPNAHLAFFQREFVERRRWIDAASYAELVALCQFLPGPASSQVGIAIGTYRAGWRGALVAWAAFTLPSAALMIAFAYGVGQMGATDAGWLQGLKAAAVAVVALAVRQMGASLAPDRGRQVLLCAAVVAAAIWRGPFTQVAVIAAGGLVGLAAFTPAARAEARALPVAVSPRAGAVCLALFAALLVALPLLRGAVDDGWFARFESFYRVGSLVFGGGHVVLPLIETEVVQSGWVTKESFLAGYGAAQAVPGPLFTFAAYLGAAMASGPARVGAGLFALAAVFLPSFLLVLGALPFWDRLRVNRSIRAALMGVNAAVVGLVVAALYDPMWTAGVRTSADFALVVGAFCGLVFLRWPAWLVVVLTGLAGGLRDLL